MKSFFFKNIQSVSPAAVFWAHCENDIKLSKQTDKLTLIGELPAVPSAFPHYICLFPFPTPSIFFLFSVSNFSLFFFVCQGYRIRLGSSTDKKDTGRLHVDFAQARDDLYEWECRQRMLAREERHRRKMEEDRLRPPSPPPIVHYSEHECSQLGDKIKGW